ncbi:hypothetical protein D9M72_523940 [compost metagenome]
MLAAKRIDQLGIDADTAHCASGAPLEDVADAELLGDQPYVDRLAPVAVHGIARDDEQASRTGKVGYQVFGQAVDERRVRFIPTHIRERQYSDRGTFGQRQYALQRIRPMPHVDRASQVL